jgi:ribosome-associated toxin RatA of RatAB toxin-antitoxin module
MLGKEEGCLISLTLFYEFFSLIVSSFQGKLFLVLWMMLEQYLYTRADSLQL